MGWRLVGMAWGATGIVPITAALAILVSSLQSAGGGFIALKCCWLGITWRRGTEHGMDEFSAIGISAALILGATVIGAAVAGGAGSPLVPVMAGIGPLNEVVGDLLGSLGYLSAAVAPGLYLRRRSLRGCWRCVVRRLLRGGR
jgi:hypothetical protein